MQVEGTVHFCLFCDACHSAHCLNRICTACCLAGEHEGVGVVEYCTGDIRHFGTCRTWVLYHGVQHLRSHDDRLLGEDALLDDHALDAGDALSWNLDAEIAAGNHDAVAVLDNLVDVVHTFLILNLRDDLDVGVCSIEDVLHLAEVFL